jgi:hypothetical protein
VFEHRFLECKPAFVATIFFFAGFIAFCVLQAWLLLAIRCSPFLAGGFPCKWGEEKPPRHRLAGFMGWIASRNGSIRRFLIMLWGMFYSFTSISEIRLSLSFVGSIQDHPSTIPMYAGGTYLKQAMQRRKSHADLICQGLPRDA